MPDNTSAASTVFFQHKVHYPSVQGQTCRRQRSDSSLQVSDDDAPAAQHYGWGCKKGAAPGMIPQVFKGDSWRSCSTILLPILQVATHLAMHCQGFLVYMKDVVRKGSVCTDLLPHVSGERCEGAIEASNISAITGLIKRNGRRHG